MAYLKFNEYKKMGYAAIGRGEFKRWAQMAEAHVRLFTCNRLADADMTPLQKRGMCELVELLHNDEKQINRTLMSFTNGSYTETYGLPSKTFTVSLAQKVDALLRLYFTAAQLYRGVSHARRG